MKEQYPADADGLMAVLRKLRAPDGCPWDRKQTRASLTKSLVSECGELLEAIDSEDVPHIREELGDVLMNVLFQAVIAEEKGEFVLADVWREIIDKMIRRHVHVFGDAHAANVDDVMRLWQQEKLKERGGEEPEASSVMDEVKSSLFSMDRAEKLQKRAAEVKFDWNDCAGIVAKIREETAEVEQALASGNEDDVDAELGDLMFAVINLIRFRKRGSADDILRRANMKFEKRFRAMEKELTASGKSFDDADTDELEKLWQKVK